MLRTQTDPLPTKGCRVRHDETRIEGFIAETPDSTASRVFVLFDGAEVPVPCHPGSLEYIEQPTA